MIPTVDRVRSYLSLNGRYVKWRLRHPRGNWTDFYVDQVETRLDQDQPHPSLGTVHADDAGFKRQGLKKVEFLKQQGLKPHHRIADYGCGSLRIGRHLMAYLDRGNYIGLDVTDRFFTEGLALLDDAFVAEKRPKLAVITDESLAEIGASSPDFVLCSGVVLHIPKTGLSEFFTSIARIIGPQTRAFIHFNEAAEYRQDSRLSWSHPPDMLIDYARRARLEATLLPKPPASERDRGSKASKGKARKKHNSRHLLCTRA